MNKDLKEHITRSLAQGVRFDGRQPLEFREVTIEYGVSATAEGSARVKLGNTEVMAGVKLAIEKPYPDRPDEGMLMVNAELLPMSNPEFEAGPPDNESIELARVVDKGVRESKAIDNKALCITPGEKAWSVMIDVISINDDGNLLDAAGIAVLAAIKNTKFPKLDADGKIDYHEKSDVSIPLSRQPLPITVFKIGDSFIVDPTLDEERVYDARLTIIVTEKNTLCALQKGGDMPLSVAEIKQMIDIAIQRAAEIRKKF